MARCSRVISVPGSSLCPALAKVSHSPSGREIAYYWFRVNFDHVRRIF